MRPPGRRSIGSSAKRSPIPSARNSWLRRRAVSQRDAEGSCDRIDSREIAVAAIQLSVNGLTVSVTVDDPDTPLLYVLRNELRLHGPRFGCGLGQCGACTVHIGKQAIRSCVTPVASVQGQDVITLE